MGKVGPPANIFNKTNKQIFIDNKTYGYLPTDYEFKVYFNYRRINIWRLVFILSFQMQTKLVSIACHVLLCSCGSCGYELNLNSSNRNTCSLIDSKSIKRGIISFFSVDESRFTQIQQLHWPSWMPFFNSKRQRTKLLCRSCGNHLGYAYTSPSQSWDGISDDSRIYDIKLTSLLPSFCEEPSQRLECISSTLVF